MEKVSNSKNSLFIVARVLGEPKKRYMLNAISRLATFLDKEHGETLIANGTQLGNRRWCTEMAGGLRVQYLNDLVEHVGSLPFAYEVGLAKAYGNHRPTLLQSEETVGQSSLSNKRILSARPVSKPPRILVPPLGPTRCARRASVVRPCLGHTGNSARCLGY